MLNYAPAAVSYFMAFATVVSLSAATRSVLFNKMLCEAALNYYD